MTYPAAARYQELDLLAMTPAQRLLLLYRHLETNLRLGLERLRAADVEGRSTRLLKAGDIVAELLGSLDPEQDGELTARLAAIYAWILAELPKLHTAEDAGRLERIITIVAELRQAWATVAEAIERDTATAQPA